MNTESLAILPNVESNPAVLYLLTLSTAESRKAQRNALACFCVWVNPALTIASFPWAELRAEHLLLWRDHVGNRLAPATANRYLAAVRSVVRQAWRMALISSEVLARCSEVPRVCGSSILRGRALEGAELRALHEAAGTAKSRWQRARDQGLVCLLYASGLRRAEVCRLRMEDVSEAEGNWVFKVKGKRNKERLVPVPMRLLEGLRKWLKLRGRGTGPLFHKERDSDAGLAPDALTKLVIAISRKSKIMQCSPHDFRRTYASRLFDVGADLPSVQGLMGHASPSTTCRYDRRGERAKAAAADRLPPML